MKKQVIIGIEGEFNEMEFENLMCDKVRTYNLQDKPIGHLDVTGTVDAPGSGFIKIIAEGEEEDLEFVIETAKRGPVISHITNHKMKFKPYTGKYKYFSKKSLLSLPKKRILF